MPRQAIIDTNFVCTVPSAAQHLSRTSFTSVAHTRNGKDRELFDHGGAYGTQICQICGFTKRRYCVSLLRRWSHHNSSRTLTAYVKNSPLLLRSVFQVGTIQNVGTRFLLVEDLEATLTFSPIGDVAPLPQLAHYDSG